MGEGRGTRRAGPVPRAIGSGEAGHVLSHANSYLRSAICVFDASGGPVHIADGDAPPFWSLAVFDPQSNEVYSMNDRTAVERRVDLTLATPFQLIALRRSTPDALAGPSSSNCRSRRATSSSGRSPRTRRGIALLTAFFRTPSAPPSPRLDGPGRLGPGALVAHAGEDDDLRPGAVLCRRRSAGPASGA